MTDVAGRIEGDAGFQFAQQREQLALEAADKLLVGRVVLVLGLNCHRILWVEIAAPEDIVAVHLQE